MSQVAYDQVVVNIGLEWLSQYARFLRRSPDVLQNLMNRPEDFEMVPVPKLILERLAVPGLIGSGSLGEINPDLQPYINFDPAAFSRNIAATSRDEAHAIIRTFCVALDAGDAGAANALFSPEFINPDGKTAADVRAALDALFRNTPNRRFQLLHIEEVTGSEADFVACIHGIWNASINTTEPAGTEELVRLEILLGRNVNDDWAIFGLKHE